MAKKDKKKRKQSQQKIPRNTYVYGHTLENVSSLTVELDPITQNLTIKEVDPSSIRRQITHKREGKDDKVLYSAPANDFSLSLTDFGELKTRFDYLMAVDTNTLNEIHKGYRVSACSIYVVRESLGFVGREIRYEHWASYIILNTDHSAKSEPIGWHLTIGLNISPAFLATSRIGIIVDSELGKHLDINAGREPYYAGHLLPSSVKLLYASSDKSATFANGMIKCCDTAASMVLAEFKKMGIDEVLKVTPIQIGTASCFPVVSIQESDPPLVIVQPKTTDE
ncbi:hypothetical protein [Pseudomonas congelans]|uniref:hypothetical protein n=1 Tax=Pseudomonas congelans TaxID=200452 RepID=UPI000BB666A0|nr:hypothetical protein [Pseudomonas congelans]PBP96433.1 hypothetical protein CCL24_15815 [Pseudomonas congelans]